jgi:hypothetical protein
LRDFGNVAGVDANARELGDFFHIGVADAHGVSSTGWIRLPIRDQICDFARRQRGILSGGRKVLTLKSQIVLRGRQI